MQEDQINRLTQNKSKLPTKEKHLGNGAYPRIMRLSVKKKSGALGVKISFFKNGIAPIANARICRKQKMAT